MASFIYAPAVRMRIESSDSDIGIVDVSRDVSQMSLTRRANAISTASFTLNNTQRKYDRIFRPGDKITIEMKRITWVRVFTGTLNEVPVFSSWPKVVSLSASCTLKKLQMFYWDPTTTAASNLMEEYFKETNTSNPQGNVSDGGIGVLLTTVLEKVVHWPKNKVHIGQIPSDFFDFAKDVNALIVGAESMEAVLTSGGMVGGSFVYGAVPLTPGVYGGIKLDKNQVDNIGKIYGTVRGRGLPDRAAVLCIMTGMVESGCRILANTGNDESMANPNKQGEGTNYDSIGIYQQRDSWGSVAERMDVSKSTVLFLNRVVSLPTWKTEDPGRICQRVQISEFPDRYNNYRTFAEGIVGILAGLYNGALKSEFDNPSTPPSTEPGGVNLPAASGKHTGQEFASVASNLITRNPPGHIRYSQANDYDAASEDPLILDCSSLVDWVYYHVFGTKWFSPRGNTRQQNPACTPIPVSLAKRVQGALVFLGSGQGTHHVAVSLGNGKVVEAATDEAPLADQVHIGNFYDFDSAGLIPNLDYSNAATDQAAANELAKYIGSTGVSKFSPTDNPTTANGGSSSSASLVESLITLMGRNVAPNGDFIGGERALINDQPIFPWVATLANSSMRSVSSAPNGDFIAWFPDYFGVWGTAAKMNIELIELQDFEVKWSDQKIVTHQYVTGVTSPMLDSGSGGIFEGGDGTYAGGTAAIHTQGVVTMGFPQIFQAIFGKAADKSFTDDYMKRFGGRPAYVQMSNIKRGKQEFFMALWLFTQAWANQFTASVPLTFMPELFPGMLLCIPDYGFQAYVEEVTHRISFGRSGGFYTDVQISAPARTSDKTDVFGLLPLAGPKK